MSTNAAATRPGPCVRPVSLARLTTFRIGGRPSFYARPQDAGGLRDALRRCREAGLPVRVLGGGSNLLVDDGELPFAVVHICKPGFDRISAGGGRPFGRRTGARGPALLRVGAGVRINALLAWCARRGLGGLEFMAAIPGTVAGALAGNAGAWGRSIGECVVRVWTMDREGREREWRRDEVRFDYRSSSLDGLVITEAELRAEPAPGGEVRNSIERYGAQKALRHPMRARSAGCVFRNPAAPAAAKWGRLTAAALAEAKHLQGPRLGTPLPWSAGMLIDRCGLKGVRVGGAEVSPVHANFICNVDGASSADVLSLIETVRRAVRDRYGIELELEVKHWARRPPAA